MQCGAMHTVQGTKAKTTLNFRAVSISFTPISRIHQFVENNAGFFPKFEIARKFKVSEFCFRTL